MDKYDFLKDSIEYAIYGVTEDVNCPTQSKFYLINDWKLPTNRQDLLSLVGLVNFYQRYAPYFEIRMKPSQKCLKLFNRKPML